MDFRPARLALLALSLAAGVGLACNTDHHPTAKRVAAKDRPKIITPLWVGPAFSGSWFTPARNGEGFTLQILDNGTALAVWFTYPPEGSPARQAWVLAQDGRIEGNRIVFPTVFTTRGPRFGAGYDPAQLQVIPWGTLEMRFTDCNTGEFTYSGPAGWGAGTRPLARLTSLSELECSGKRRVTTNGARSLSGLRQRSGALFDPSHNGEGWQYEELPNGGVQVYWFTYDENGEQAWTTGVGTLANDRVTVAQSLQPVGTRFGSGFDPSRVQLVNWGGYTLDFSGCDRGTVAYQSSLAAFGSGTLRPVRLTKLAGNACVEGTPAVPSGGMWSQGPNMPVAESEVASAVIGTRSCIAGGFAGRRTFQCFDTATNTWENLAPLPNGRDHALAIAFGGEMFVTGGNRGGGDPSTTGWRFVAAENRWEEVAQLPEVVQSSATVLDGYAYFGDMTGDLVQYDPRTRASRRIRTDFRAGRDHAQIVAFQGEIWMIGGRDGTFLENNTVSIYDPASETWRVGPSLATPRAGHGVVSTGNAILLAGGEKIPTPARVISSMESIAAGQDTWTTLTPLPFPVHGVGATLHGNAFHVLGGSRQAGLATNDGRLQVYRW